MKSIISKIQQLLIFPLGILLISACGPSEEVRLATVQSLAGTKLAQTATALVPMNTATLTPTATVSTPPTSTITQTPEPTPYGGGGQIAFASNRGGDYEIYLMNPDGGGPTQLTNNSFDDNEPAWSPDRDYVVYVSFLGEAGYALNVVLIAGNAQRVIADFDLEITSPSWSSDGLIVFSANVCVFECDSDSRDCVGCYRDYLSSINSNGSDLTVYSGDPTNIYAPDFSPDGFEVVATRNNTIQRIRLGSKGGINIVSLNNNQDGAWSPDGSRIAFASFQDGEYDIFIVTVGNGEITRLTESPGFDRSPTWSPDGTKIAFASKRDGNWEIYVMDVDGSNVVRLTNDPADDIEPAWAP